MLFLPTLPPLLYLELNQEFSFEFIKGDLFSKGSFTLILSTEKCAQSVSSTLSFMANVEDSNLAHFFKNGNKVKIASAIKPPSYH